MSDQERGFGLFKLAARFNFIQGRRTKDVAAVCLYITCRMKDTGSEIMLIDLSDVLMVGLLCSFRVLIMSADELRSLMFSSSAKFTQLCLEHSIS